MKRLIVFVVAILIAALGIIVTPTLAQGDIECSLIGVTEESNKIIEWQQDGAAQKIGTFRTDIHIVEIDVSARGDVVSVVEYEGRVDIMYTPYGSARTYNLTWQIDAEVHTPKFGANNIYYVVNGVRDRIVRVDLSDSHFFADASRHALVYEGRRGADIYLAEVASRGKLVIVESTDTYDEVIVLASDYKYRHRVFGQVLSASLRDGGNFLAIDSVDKNTNRTLSVLSINDSSKSYDIDLDKAAAEVNNPNMHYVRFGWYSGGAPVLEYADNLYEMWYPLIFHKYSNPGFTSLFLTVPSHIEEYEFAELLESRSRGILVSVGGSVIGSIYESHECISVNIEETGIDYAQLVIRDA